MNELLVKQCTGPSGKFATHLPIGHDSVKIYLNCLRVQLNPYDIGIDFDWQRMTYYYTQPGNIKTVFNMTWEWKDIEKPNIILAEAR